jgi:hypothetical protein
MHVGGEFELGSWILSFGASATGDFAGSVAPPR